MTASQLALLVGGHRWLSPYFCQQSFSFNDYSQHKPQGSIFRMEQFISADYYCHYFTA